VYISEEMENSEPLAEYLWEEHGKKVPIKVPKIGEKKHLINMAISNAKLNLGQRKLEKQKFEKERIPQAVKDLKEYLHLQRLPRRIECFDNSNIQGTDPVASMVCFVDAKPRKSEYKRFKIKTVTGPDDFASMKEIVMRRYGRVKREKLQAPDLILIDGGKGQLNAAVQGLREIGFEGECEIAGIAKRMEEIFVPGKSDPYMIPKKSSALKLLQRARDEAHRFAINYHRDKRSKRTLKTELTDIDGIGDKTARDLIKTFGSVKQIRKTEVDQLKEAIGEKKGEAVYDYFHRQKESVD
jgi:excinuclease ABC subunit C